MGHLDIVVNAAGTVFSSLLARAGPERAQTVLETNLLGATYMCKASMAHLRKTNGQILDLHFTGTIRHLTGSKVLFSISQVSWPARASGANPCMPPPRLA